MAEIVKYTVMGRGHEAERDANLLVELRKNGYEVPTLCHHAAFSPYGACRLCLVEVQKGKKRKLTTSCNYPVRDGIEVFLDTEKVIKNRKMVLELLLARAPRASSDLRNLAESHGLSGTRFPLNRGKACILCGLCVRTCSEGIGANALTFSGRGDQKVLSPPYWAPDACIGCRSCANVCPTGAIPVSEKDGTRKIWARTFELARCSDCGVPTLPKEQIEHLVSETRLSADYFELCDECRRKQIAGRFNSVMGR